MGHGLNEGAYRLAVKARRWALMGRQQLPLDVMKAEAESIAFTFLTRWSRLAADKSA